MNDDNHVGVLLEAISDRLGRVLDDLEQASQNHDRRIGPLEQAA